MQKFNVLGNDFSSDQTLDEHFDLGIACDLLIDLSLYGNTDLKPELIKQDFDSFNRTGQQFTAQDFYKRIKNDSSKSIIEVTFNVVAKARMLGLFQNLTAVSNNLGMAMLDESDSYLRADFSRITRAVIE